jgi:hypothetical protein
MEVLRISIFAVYLTGIFSIAGLGLGLHTIHRRGIRRYKRILDHQYTERFERRTMVAKSVHSDLTQVIRRSKSVVDQMRLGATDAPERTDALDQVSQWLAGAAGESDRALRSLESDSARVSGRSYIVGGEHADTKADSHHDR